jgi:hypothetical protein
MCLFLFRLCSWSDHFLRVLVSDASRTPSIAHELTRRLFSFRRDGLLETVGPAGTSSQFFYIFVVNDLHIFADRRQYHEHKVRNRKKLYYLYAHATSVSVSGLVDQLTNVERIANTPIPKSCTIFFAIFRPWYLTWPGLL